MLERIKQLIDILNKASKAYYQEDIEIMSNFEYDKLYDELVDLEKKTGIVLSNSPTINVGYEILSELEKEKHESKMLSLDKTKDVEKLKEFLKDEEGILSWKMDGLTVVLTYNNGSLVKAVTRGNGEIGEVITNNAKVFSNIPLNINYKKELVIRGEAVIKYSDFEKINSQIEDVQARYKNPRNLCSGTVRQLNNEITANRNVHFFAFSLVNDINNLNKIHEKLDWLSNLGFDVVERKLVNKDNIEDIVKIFENNIQNNDFPSDGLVLIYDDIQYGKSLGNTAKFPKNSIAFKWEDETAQTKLLDIEWSASRTGLINPIAIFEPVELEGTIVSRASLHNVSILQNLELGIGDDILIYKANMIIPQIAENLTKSKNCEIPKICPVCGKPTKIKDENNVKVLYCINNDCIAKKIKLFTHFVARDTMNIEGLSEATIEKLITKGFIKEFSDIFHVEKYKDEIINMEGFGEKSYKNLINSIKKARITTPAKLIYSLGIENIGLSNAKLICKSFDNDLNKIINISLDELVKIQGIGDIIAKSFVDYFNNEYNKNSFKDLLNEIQVVIENIDEEKQKFQNITFVITGSFEYFENRDKLKEVIEKNGGKVTSTVSKKTSYLINNDNMSNSSKNKKAKELNIPIITEQEFIKMIE